MKPKESEETLNKSDVPLNLKTIHLPKPKIEQDIPVFEALKLRRTIRTIGNRELSLQELSNLLWSAWGVNREHGPFGIQGRTAASASNSQEIQLYIALKDGIYLYDAVSNILNPVVDGDYRVLAVGRGQQSPDLNTPVQLIYVVDMNKFKTAGFQEPGLYDSEVQKSYYFVDTGLIAQNVFLFAASQGLAAWFHNCDKQALAKLLNLGPNQRALFAQTVGYPENEGRYQLRIAEH